MHVKVQLTLKQQIFVWKYSLLKWKNSSAKMQSGQSQATLEGVESLNWKEKILHSHIFMISLQFEYDDKRSPSSLDNTGL